MFTFPPFPIIASRGAGISSTRSRLMTRIGDTARAALVAVTLWRLARRARAVMASGSTSTGHATSSGSFSPPLPPEKKS